MEPGSEDRVIDIEPGEVLEFGGSGRRGRWRRAWIWGVAALVVAIAVAGVVRARRHDHPAPPPPIVVAPSPAVVSSPPPAPSTSPPPRVVDVGHPLLGIDQAWDLFGRLDSAVVRVEPARGRVTTTPVPPLASSGPVSFFADADGALIVPLDNVPAYLVPDGQPARPLARDQNTGVAFPGPDPTHFWVEGYTDGNPAMILVDARGHETGLRITVPDDLDISREPDGTGYFVLSGPGGVYDARVDGLHRVTTGQLLAIGPTRWLASECDDRHRCQTVVIDRAGGARHVLPGVSPHPVGPYGLVSPPGSAAVVVEWGGDAGATRVDLINLASGAEHVLDVSVDASVNVSSMVWSPDGRWLFLVDATGRLCAVEARTATVRDLGVSLPPLAQLAVRGPSG